MKMQFLEANKPLTKSYFLDTNGKLDRKNYPEVFHFTSHAETCNNLAEFHAALRAHAKLGHCLLKGSLEVPLINQSRAGSTSSDATTDWICLDFDKAPFATVEEALSKIHKTAGGGVAEPSPFEGVSYVVQYSASHGLPGVAGLNCHVFMQLSHQYHAPYLKSWLMYLNLTSDALTEGLKLSATNTHLSWPLDITTCQNDKLLFIAPPVLAKDVKSTLKEAERYMLIVRKHSKLPIDRIPLMDQSTMRTSAHNKKNELREKLGMIKQRNSIKADGDHYVVGSPGESIITGGPWVGPEFTYFDLNHGDSRSYWHPNDNYEFIHCFKHPDEWMRAKDLLPAYYAQCERERIKRNTSPTAAGELLLTFRDFRSSTYWNGTWDPKTYKLDIHVAGTVRMLDDYREQHGKGALDFIPTWNILFDPHSDVVVDETNKVVNTYIPTDLMRAVYKTPGSLSACPMTLKTFLFALNCTEDSEELEHFLNWLAVIYQKRIKTQTVWVLSGIQGTGKGVITNDIIARTLGEAYVAIQDGAIMEDNYNGWIENKLFVSLNEVDIASSTISKKILTKLKHWINEPTMPMRHMYRGSYEAKSYCNFLMSANETAPLQLSQDDRRYNIGNYQPDKLIYTTADIEAIRKENKAWMNYIMTRKADVNYARAILHNEARQRLVDVSLTSNESVAYSLLNGDLMHLQSVVPDMALQVDLHGMNTGFASHYEAVVRREVTGLVNMGLKLSAQKLSVREKEQLRRKHPGADITFVRSRLTREEMYTIFEFTVGNMPATPIKFTQFLRHRGINIEPVKVDGLAKRGIYVTWTVTSEQLDELKAWLSQKPAAPTSAAAVIAKAKLKLIK